MPPEEPNIVALAFPDSKVGYIVVRSVTGVEGDFVKLATVWFEIGCEVGQLEIGFQVGISVFGSEGEILGNLELECAEGFLDGEFHGEVVGSLEGLLVGSFVGKMVSQFELGPPDGLAEGSKGSFVGVRFGKDVELMLG